MPLSSPSPSPAVYIMEDPREGSRLEQKIDPHRWVKNYLASHLFPGVEVLDAGCGPGTILRAVAAAQRRAIGTGVDVGAARLRQAQDNNIGNSRLKFFRGDVQELDFASGVFDVVYARMLLQYVPDKEKAVGELVRVCKPGGTVLLQDLDGQLVWHYPEDA